jgi:hypothetical protein
MFYPKKKFAELSENMGWEFWDPGSGKKLIPDPGSRGQKSTESRILIFSPGFLYHNRL